MTFPSPLRGVTSRLHISFSSRNRRRVAVATGTVLLASAATGIASLAPPAVAQSLQGSHESLMKQNLVAQQHGYAYLRTTQDLQQAVAAGVLVEVRGNGDFELAGEEVSFPYARPEVKVFLAQLGQAYRTACGEPLVVTSLARPITHQPWNASPLSVHPTGMAVDMRRSDRRACRQFMDSTLLALEGEGMIEATREHWPAHYHVAVFPDPLLLPGPIGDPSGVIRLAALHRQSYGTMQEADSEPDGRVRVVRSQSGRLRITQTRGAAIAHRGAHSSRIVVRRSKGATHHRAAAHPGAAAAVNHHRSGHPASAATTRTTTAR
jgi:Family of unknown function (DUF5715)